MRSPTQNQVTAIVYTDPKVNQILDVTFRLISPGPLRDHQEVMIKHAAYFVRKLGVTGTAFIRLCGDNFLLRRDVNLDEEAQ